MNAWPFWLALVLGLWLVTFNTLGFDLSLFPGDFGDGRFNTYILEHCHRYFTGQEDSFWNAPFMYPEPSVITYSDNLVGTAPLYSLLRILGMNPYTSFQGWYILLTVGNFAACYGLLTYIFKNPYAAALGAFVFAFSLALQTQLTHAQTFPRLFIPLAIWMLLLYRKELAPKYLFLAILFLVWQFYAGIYLGFLLSIPFGIILLIILFQNRMMLKQSIKKVRWLLFTFGGIIINVALLLKLMIPYAIRAESNIETPYHEIVGTLPTIRSYFCSKWGTLFWDGLTDVTKIYGAHWDHQLFPGIITLLAIVFFILALFFFRKKIALPEHMQTLWILGIAGLISGLMVFRVNSFSLYAYIYHIPGFSSMRALGRVINVNLLFFGLAVAFCMYLLYRKWPRYSKLIFALLLVLLMADNYMDRNAAYTIYKADIIERSEAMRDLLKDVPAGSVVSYEPVDENVPMFVHQLDAMLATQELNLIAINAYTATSPADYSDYWWNPNPTSRMRWLNAMGIKDSVYVFSESIGITPKFGK